ncbi:restriction endonuclease subunit S [Helicobacter pylori]
MDALTTPSNWQRVRLGDILSYEQPTKFLVATTQYLQKGFTPILTAGKTFILGYTNDKHGIYTNIPVIIFDDFTTDSKMVNFPFKVKSSAIKILSLRDNNQADLKYIYEKLTLLKHQVTDHKRYWIDEFSNFEILLPPLNEQIAIANILSDVDHYLYSLDALILKKESVKKALSFELLSQRKRLKGFNQAWQRVRLGDIAEIKRGASPRPIENPKWFCANSNVGWVRISDISKNSRFLHKTAQKLSKKGIEKSRFIKQNSLIMSMCATIGKPIITKIDTCIHDGFVVFENPKTDLNYLYYFLCYIEKEWLESGQQGSQVNLNVDLIKNKEVFCPKDLNEQIAIANILSDLDHEIISLKNKKRQFENIKKALNHDLMSAKIRVLKK